MVCFLWVSNGPAQHAIVRKVVCDTDCSAGTEEAEAGNLSRRRIVDELPVRSSSSSSVKPNFFCSFGALATLCAISRSTNGSCWIISRSETPSFRPMRSSGWIRLGGMANNAGLNKSLCRVSRPLLFLGTWKYRYLVCGNSSGEMEDVPCPVSQRPFDGMDAAIAEVGFHNNPR